MIWTESINVEQMRTEMVENLPFGLWCADYDKKVLVCDKNFSEIVCDERTMFSFDELSNKVRADYRNVVMMMFGELLDSGQFDMEFPLEQRWVQVHLIDIKREECKAIGYIMEAKVSNVMASGDSEEAMAIATKTNQLLLKIFDKMMDFDSEEVLTEILTDMLTFLGADRISMLRYDDLKGDISCTHGATRYGVESRIGILKDLMPDSIPWLWGNIEMGKMTIIEDVSRLSSDSLLEVDALCNYNAKTMVIHPLRIKERTAGFLIVDYIMSRHDVRDHEKNCIRVLGECLEYIIYIREKEQRHQSEREQLSAVIKNSPLGYLSLRITYDNDNMPEDLMISRVNEVFEKYIQIEGIEGRMMSEVLGKESKHLMQVCQEVARDFEKTSSRIVDDFLYCNGVSLSAMVMMAGYNEFVCFATPTSSLLYSMVHNLSSGLHDTRLSKELQHKIRTYLNTIVGFSELMKDEEDTNVKEEYINIINENAEELINVTNIKEDSDMESQKTFVSQDGTEKEQEKPTILVAEDTESNYMLVSYILKNQYNLVWAHDGIEALELYEKTKPDLILMDVRMPRLGGLSATSKIRETDKTTPIIALTAFAFESDKSKTLEAGCTDFLSKPINVSVLKSTVGKYLKK